MAAKEKIYADQLKSLGIYDPAFDGEIHQLCILERELSRARKQWKASATSGEAPSLSHPLYGVITQIQRDILAHRDALGLTPKALKRLVGELDFGRESSNDEPPTVLGFVLGKQNADR